MGLNLIGSSSSYDKSPANYFVEPAKLPNPDPKNFKIIRSERFGHYLIVEVVYPDCKNYEGRKVMVYYGATVAKLKAQGSLDPHFSENPNFFSPIARFVPNTMGWELACFLCRTLNKSDEEHTRTNR